MNTWTPEYAPWRHGGWYVTNVHYPSGAVGCVSRNYSDEKWRIACAEAYPGSPTDRTFRSRDDAARAERELIKRVTLEYTEPVNVPADPDVEPQPYGMPSPEADALDRIAEARWDYRDNSTDGMALFDATWFAATVGDILRETRRS